MLPWSWIGRFLYGTFKVPPEIASLFDDPAIAPEALNEHSSLFFHLLAALKEFTDQSETHTLPLTSILPDMKSDTASYIHLQKLYKGRAEEEKQAFKSHLRASVPDTLIDVFVKNAHALHVLRGTQWGTFDRDKPALGLWSLCLIPLFIHFSTVNALAENPKAASIHLALSALSAVKEQGPTSVITTESLRKQIQNLVGDEVDLPECFDDAIGEM